MSAVDRTETAALAINNLALDLLVHATKLEENTAFSPYSIQMALVMTYAGAEGDTRQQMARVLHYPSSERDVLEDFAHLQDNLAKMTKRTEKIAAESKKAGGPSEPITLNMAKRLFGQRGYEFRPAYLDLLKKTLGSPLEALDFISDPGGATKDINHWIAKQTKERIRDLIPPNALNKDTRLVLANAVYLKAPWSKEFKESETRPAPFHFADGRSADVPMTIARMPLVTRNMTDSSPRPPLCGRRSPVPRPIARYRRRTAKSRKQIDAGSAREMRPSQN